MATRVCHACGQRKPLTGFFRFRMDDADMAVCPDCQDGLTEVIAEVMRTTQNRKCDYCGQLRADTGFARIRFRGVEPQIWLCPDCRHQENHIRDLVAAAVIRWVREQRATKGNQQCPP